MQEAFLHFIWRTGRFDQRRLMSSRGESISIFKRGHYHHHAGPDFNAAHMRIGDTVWHGNVEMHIRASEWYEHKHHEDPAYDNTILHVVWKEDCKVFRTDGSLLPCLELSRRVDPKMFARYHELIKDTNGIPCKFSLKEIDNLTKRTMMDRALIERLERKAREVLHTLKQCKGDWEETVWQHLAGGLGGPINTDPMTQLARQLPLKLLKRYAQNPKQVEGLIFGQAGMLENIPEESYTKSLQTEYQFLQKKHNLIPIPHSRWKFLRMRPISFPTLRLARLASLAIHHQNALSNILMAAKPIEWTNSLEVLVHPYWSRHYRFGMPSKVILKTLGKTTNHNLVINVMAPILFAYGLERGESIYQERALKVLENLTFEKNHITNKWRNLPMPAVNAADSQAILELQKNYCTPRRCIHCAIGCKLIANIRQGNPIIAEEPIQQVFAFS